jgi:hypothetical protein
MALILCWGAVASRTPGPRPTLEAAMTAAAPTPTAEVVLVEEPPFTAAERAALAGFLASHSGPTRDAYTLDLRQYTSWCQQHGLHLCTHAAPTSKLRPRHGSPRPSPRHDRAAAVHDSRPVPLRSAGLRTMHRPSPPNPDRWRDLIRACPPPRVAQPCPVRIPASQPKPARMAQKRGQPTII